MKFFGYLWRFIERLVKAVQVIIFLFVVAFIIALLSGRGGVGVSVPERAALIIAPEGMLVDAPGQDSVNLELSRLEGRQPETSVRDIVESLRRAADDERIAAVVLAPDYLQGGGLSKLQTIADALAEFRETGKPVIAMGDSYDQNQYFLAAQADEVYMHDFGFVLIEGFGYYKAYFADAIEKLNVDVNVFRVGEYKSFVEPYLRNDMSAEDREAARRWLESLWSAYRRDVLAARGIGEDVFDRYVNEAARVLAEADGDAGQAALNAGLVDGLKSHQAFRDYMVERVGRDEEREDTFSHIDFRDYLAATDEKSLAGDDDGDKVAVIVATGEIVDGEGEPGVIGSDSLVRLIREAQADDSVRALVLQVDSPGGSMFASEVILDQLQALQAAGKPYVASMSSVAASGGYYISMGADEIWAAETTISGSIGVGAIFPTFQRSLKSLGVSVDGFGTGKLSGQISPVMELGEEGRRLLDLSVRSAYDVFVDKVARNRDLDRQRVDELARGRVWIGADAKELGLVDHLGGLDDALEAAAALAGLPEDGWEPMYIRDEPSLAEELLMRYLRLLEPLLGLAGLQTQGLGQQLASVVRQAGNALAPLSGWHDPRGIYYHCLCQLR